VAVGAVAAALSPAAARADVSLPLLLSDGCVLQQKAPVRIWGTADPGEKVTVSLQDKTAAGEAGQDGKFSLTLKDLKPGGPYVLTVRGARNSVTVRDVLVGEVWVCSGQSNMEWPLSLTDGAPAEVAASADPQLRMFTVTKRVANAPQDEVAGGKWQAAAPDTSPGFSAVGYYFAKALRQSRKVPVGMIHTSWGGTRIETWISRASLKKADTPPGEFDWLTKADEAVKKDQGRYEKQLAAYKAAGSPTGTYHDPGPTEAAKGWAAADQDDAGWGTATAPGEWDSLGKEDLTAIDGGVWFRRAFDVPADAAGKPATLTLGAIDDFDTTYVNGTKVGATGEETPNFWEAKRRYTVPAGVLKAGRNVLAVRVWDHQGGGGMTGPADEMRLTPEGGVPVPLAGGEWRYKVEVSRPSSPAPPGGLDPQAATGLYNGMLHPLTPYAIRGAIWYQGESNAGAPMRYRTLMPALIEDWRAAWGEPNFPFYMVQLAPFSAGNPQGMNWAELRESQVVTAATLANVGTAVTTDVGDLNDIHPRNKRPVGERLALLARRYTYGEKVQGQGPTVRDFEREADTVEVIFDNVGAGLEARGQRGQLVGWEICGGDGKYYPAQAVIKGKDRVVVGSPEVSAPFHVRYGWANFPVVNLYSKDGLPASPFRTDVPLIAVEGK
jgi:sialate O-acetylesterase